MTNLCNQYISRRNFLRTTLLTAGAVTLLTQCSPKDSTADSNSAVKLTGAKLTRTPQRIILAQSRLIPNLYLVDEHIVDKLVGWSQDFKGLYPSEFAKWQQLYPKLATLPVIGNGMAQTLSTERIISLKPDLVIYSRPNVGPAADDSLNQDFIQLTNAGIAILIVDFFTNPLTNTIPSIKLLAKVLDSHHRSKAFVELYQEKLTTITTRLQQKQPTRPKVFMHAHAGSAACCYSVGSGVFNDFITTAGGNNIAAELLKTPTGQIAKEYVISAKADIYLASGTNTKNSVSHFVIGPDVTADQARQSLLAELADSGFSELPAIKNKRAYGFWHAFNDSIANIVLVEQLAKWFHPTIFQDLTPEQTLQLLNTDYLLPPLTGTFWIQI